MSAFGGKGSNDDGRRYANYEAFIGVPWEGSGCSGQASIKRRISDRLISPSP
jgi:hypothetical protein